MSTIESLSQTFLSGGTISAVTGGKFANGATTAALAQAVNGNNDLNEARERQQYLESLLNEFKALVNESEGEHSYASVNVSKMSVTYDSDYDGVADIRSRTGKLTIGRRFFDGLSAPPEATQEQAKFINALSIRQKELFVFKHELAHLHPENIKMVDNTMIVPDSRAEKNYEIHATTRAFKWARRTFGE